MDEIDQTYHKLKHIPFKEMVQLIYDADPHGSYTFSRMNKDNVWRVAQCFEYLLIENYWDVKEFNALLHEDMSEN